MKTSQAAEILGMSANQLLQIIHRHEIQVPKDIDRYIWNEAHIEEVRAALRRDEERRREETAHQGLTAREAAARLGIGYEELLGFVHERGIAVPRRGGPNRPYAFDEASLDFVRRALEEEEGEPEPPPRGLTTKEAAVALGVSYPVLVQRMKPLREELCLQKAGAYLLWHPEAVARMREALVRQERGGIGEPEDYGHVAHSVELLAGALRQLAADLQKLIERR